MKHIISVLSRLTVLLALLMCSGCAVIAVADAVITVGATAVKTAAKATGAVIDAVIPDSKDAKKKLGKKELRR